MQVIDGMPYIVGPMSTFQTRNEATLRQILNLAIRNKLPDVDFIFSTTDPCRDMRDLPRSIDVNLTRCERNVSIKPCSPSFQPPYSAYRLLSIRCGTVILKLKHHLLVITKPCCKASLHTLLPWYHSHSQALNQAQRSVPYDLRCDCF